MALEKRGLATAVVVTDAFARYARRLAGLSGMEALPLVALPHPVAGRASDEVEAMAKAARAELAAALTRD